MRKKKRASSGPNQSYLISFGDTMTALLAFFIVLNSLASEQTGAALYSGTGSFISATDAFGVPGIFPGGRSQHSLQLEHSSPLYQVSDPTDDSKRGDGPDDENDHLLLRDRELDDFERMLNELERLHAPSKKSEIAGEITLDRHRRLPTEGSRLDKSLKNMFAELRPALNRKDTEVEIVVWTPTPAPSAWERSAKLAAEVRVEAASYLQLNAQQEGRFKSSSRQWISKSLGRPVLSTIIRRTR